MSVLHLISVNLRLQPELLAQIQASTMAGDAVLLLGNGIYGADLAARLPARLYVLKTDSEASGVHPANSDLIDHADMVTLCEHHERSLTWS
ncbi:sulfur relay protein TusB/DsrH [Fluviicoccus keumensis]|uniref:Sulfur relay protein TusB/DsrH n=1 Tax=Fluviicoccus keumensis TaxID=1435465 RepID=A0A4Q7Z3Q2_9GAMM|nr:DsrH/TusB family sulfur metabolism protein [Fluviicoccus keumensis]RZU44907.1 sulfur relay protein TusB/DsrH [Fluviicoccus keumensis]